MFVLIALLPVLLFVLELRLLDSFKLVHVSAVAASIAWGGAAALVCLGPHQWLLGLAIIDDTTAGRYVAPVTEETLKAAFVAILIARGRIGFSVDAAIHGFAVGAGFALVENGVYLLTLPAGPLVWVVRGFGTAVLHGSTTAIFALISRTLADSRRRNLAVAFLPGWLAATLMHATFNQALSAPFAATVTLLILMPAIALIVFQQSERATRRWIGAGMDRDVDLLQMLRSDVFLGTSFGVYLLQLRERFPGPTVVDMFCLLRLELESSVQAKALLLAREAGIDLPVDADLRASLAEVMSLNQSIGAAGRLALRPLRTGTRRDDWHRYLLAQRDPYSVLWRRVVRRLTAHDPRQGH